MLCAARSRKSGSFLVAATGLWAFAAAGGALAQQAPRSPRPGEGIEAVAADVDRDASTTSLINAVAPPPPPPPSLRCPEPVKCAPDSDFSQIAWIFAGLTSAGLLLSTWWGVTQQKRTKVYREELSRIRIHRTSSIRTVRSLGESTAPVGEPGLRTDATPASNPATAEEWDAAVATPLGRASSRQAPPPSAVASPAAPVPADPAAEVRVRQEADARLAMAQAQLEPLLRVARSVEEWFRSPPYEAALSAASAQRGFLDRIRRGVVSVAATFHALRDAHVFPTTTGAIDDELERYWEQVYESLDDIYQLVGLVASDEGRRALAASPGGDAVRTQLEQLESAAREYLASDGRRPIPIEPMRTDFDRRIHVAVETRRVEGVPAGKVIAVVRCGVVRDGRLVRKPEVIASG